MAQKVESKQERPLQRFSFKNFLAANTTASRLAINQQSFYALENAQPIGASNIAWIPDISGAIHNYGADTIYYDENVNLSDTEYLIQASTTGKLFAFNVPGASVTQINGSTVLSGSQSSVAQWNDSDALIIDSTGYYVWTGTGNITAITGSGAPTSGTAICVYQNRVWIAQGRVLFYSAPGSYTDFTTADGGGSSSLIDPTLRSTITALFAVNGYLYVWGTSSINAISDLYIPTSSTGSPITPPTPTFTNLNLSAVVGTDQPSSIIVYGRLVLFANRLGIWMLYGTTVQSISAPDPNNAYGSDIDGTLKYVTYTQPISAAQVVVNGLLCAAFVVQRNSDPTFGSNTIELMYQGDAAGGKWWNANYGAVTRINTAFVNGAPACFGYIGNQLYQLFADTTSAPAALVMTALMDFGDPITQKECIRGGIGISVAGTADVTLYLDTPQNSFEFPVNINGQVQWINDAGATVSWKNSSNAPVTWQPGQFTTYWSQAPRGDAKYVGFKVVTVKGSQFTIYSFLLDYKWAAAWVGN